MRRKSKNPWLNIIAVALTVMCVVVICFGVQGYIMLDTRIRALENQATITSLSDMQSAVDFLKDQTQVLIWLLGVIIASAGAILAFFGITTRKSIEEKYDLLYRELLAAKDTEVFKKEIVFLHNENDDIIGFRNEIRDRGYNTRLIRSSSPNVLSELNNASIVIYCVDSESDPLYQSIAHRCETMAVHCILFCPGVRLPDDFMREKRSYLSISLQIAKLRESLYTLLYLAP